MKKIFILLFLLLAVYKVFAVEMNRDSSKECAACHYEWMPEFLFDLKGTDLVDYQSEKVVATEKMCFSCHNGTVGDSRIRIWSGDRHNIGDKIPEDFKIPATLPLDNGAINCRTCHSAHATGDPKTEGVRKSVFLRMENDDSQLCKACHTDLSNGIYRSHPLEKPEKNHACIEKKLEALSAKLGSQGQLVCESCHTSHSPKDKKLLIYKENDSKLCSVCHDDKVKPQSAQYLKGMLNHPINIKHDNADQVERVKKEGGVYGKDNEVICLTCHSSHKGETKTLLIKKNDQSRLCITCHDDKKKVINGKHNMSKVEGFRTKEGKTARQKGTCQSCHAPHGWSLDLPEGDDMLSKACLSCHRKGGFSNGKTLFNDRFNHPVGQEVKREMLSVDLPLFIKDNKYLNESSLQDGSQNMITCATCHDVHSTADDFLRLEAVNGRLCLTCHSEKKMMNLTDHSVKKLSKGCLSCHVVHNSQTKRLLQESRNDGCLDCHKKGGSAENVMVDLNHSHPANMPVTKGLKKGFKLTENGFFTCASCHDPHKQSKTETMPKDFLRGGYNDPDAFCIACHQEKKEIIGSDHDHRKKETDSVCHQCHSVHKAQTIEGLMAVAFDYKGKDDYCRACHNPDGLAEKKLVTGGHKLGRIANAQTCAKHLVENKGSFFIRCSSCHTVHNNGPEKGGEGTIQNSFLDRNLSAGGNFCSGCHQDKRTFSASKHNVKNFKKSTAETNALMAQGDNCGICHKVHNSGDYLFEKSFGGNFEKICADCHTDNGLASAKSISTSHKINIVLENNRDAYLQKGRMVCVTCHQPHAENKAMLRDFKEKNLCIDCHTCQKTVAFSRHNLAQTQYMDNEAGRRAKDNPCFACHKPHNFDQQNRLMWAFSPRKKGEFAHKICTDCHAKGGVGRQKIPEAISHDRIFKIFPLKIKEQFKKYLFNDNGFAAVDGSITCQSCHNPHVYQEGETGVRHAGVQGNTTNGFLKENIKSLFCVKCHGKEKTEDLYGNYHDKKFRTLRLKKQSESEVLQNLLLIQMNLQKIEGEK